MKRNQNKRIKCKIEKINNNNNKDIIQRKVTDTTSSLKYITSDCLIYKKK